MLSWLNKKQQQPPVERPSEAQTLLSPALPSKLLPFLEDMKKDPAADIHAIHGPQYQRDMGRQIIQLEFNKTRAVLDLYEYDQGLIFATVRLDPQLKNEEVAKEAEKELEHCAKLLYDLSEKQGLTAPKVFCLESVTPATAVETALERLLAEGRFDKVYYQGECCQLVDGKVNRQQPVDNSGNDASNSPRP